MPSSISPTGPEPDANSAQNPVWPRRQGVEGALQTVDLVEFDGATSTLKLVRQINIGSEVVSKAILWSHVTDPDHANDMLEALAASSNQMALLTSCTILFGTDWCESMVAAMTSLYIDDRTRMEMQQRAAAAAAAKISAYFREKGRYFTIDLQRGDASDPFWQISFEQKYERERFWDWMRNQTDRFEDVRRQVAEGRGDEVENLFLQEMLVTERLIKKQGLGAGGRRPLRFWRGVV